MELIIRPLVTRKQVSLLRALIEKGYFSTDEAALTYVQGIRDFINSIPNVSHYRVRDTTYGEFYAAYRPNKNTTWYVLFDKKNDQYIIKNIINNHTPDYPKFIAALQQK